MINTDILITGGGAAGMAAALTAAEQGSSVVLADQNDRLGGILNRCIHHGFGLGQYDEDLTGQEYAARYLDDLQKICDDRLHILTGTTVLEIRPNRTALLSSYGKIQEAAFKVLVLATGSYEVPPESALISGTRPAGVMTAGCAQGLINEGGQDIGSRIVILGSGNVGMIMAGQLTDAGKTIVAMIEQNSAHGGLARNYHEYVEGRNIPLMLDSAVTSIHGEGRITGVTVRDLKSDTEKVIACDTLITALGLIPDTTLIDHLKASTAHHEGKSAAGVLPDWVILAGNCDHIYDFADAVTAAGEKAGVTAASLCRDIQDL